MTEVRAQVILQSANGVPADAATNTFSFRWPDTEDYSTEVTAILKAFYDDVGGYISPLIQQNGHLIKFVDHEGPAPQYPFAETSFNLAAAPTGVAFPREVALVMSFQADRSAGVNQKRRKGRIYLGPLNTAGNLATGLVLPAMCTTVNTAAEEIQTACQAVSVLLYWTVWSTMNASSSIVANGWCDNAWDTQRSRGNVATTRSTWSF